MPVTPADALIIVDVQNDFLRGGALVVPGAERILPVINQLTDMPFQTIVTTQDWHPADHCSFHSSGGPWPRHCVQGTYGAELSSVLHTRRVSAFFRKGTMRDTDSYSAFSDAGGYHPTGLNGFLHERGVKRVFVCGLAYDVCVADTACDAALLEFETRVITDACASIQPETARKATSRLYQRMIGLVTARDLNMRA